MKKLILLIISTTLLLSCKQPEKIKEEQVIKKQQVNNVIDKPISLLLEPSVFKISELPDTVTVTMFNNTKDTIVTGMHYYIERMEANQWKKAPLEGIAFNDIGLVLKPNNTKNFEKRLYKDQINYTAGKYRIVKYYIKSDYLKTKDKFYLYAEFNILE